MTATTAPHHELSGARTPGFGARLASEWTKLRSVRSTWIMIALALILSIGFSALIAWVQGLTYDDWGPNEQAVFDPLLNSTTGVLFSLILLVVFGVLAVTSEYSSGMIRTTFIATPQRISILAAKALIVGFIGMILSGIAIFGMFLASQTIFGAYGMETASLGDSDVQRLLIVYTFAGGLIYTLIPLALGFLLRGTASAITTSIGLFFLPWMFAPLLPTWMQENVFRYFPDIAMDSLGGVTSADSSMYLSQTPATITIALWIIGSLVIAGFMLNRRDA
jgi:ABC-2 type transport system permease protein